LNAPLATTIAIQQQQNGIQLLPIQLSHILALATLPFHHNDPFDRLLIAQAQVENLAFITNDSKIQQYGIAIHW
jgi:PIN domain nuclease of toxin-antitoxin system